MQLSVVEDLHLGQLQALVMLLLELQELLHKPLGVQLLLESLFLSVGLLQLLAALAIILAVIIGMNPIIDELAVIAIAPIVGVVVELVALLLSLYHLQLRR
jgi:hypothetical protein